MTSPVRPWFRFDLEDPDKSKFRKFREWLDGADVMTSVMSQVILRGTGAVWAQGPTYGTGDGDRA